MLTPESVRSQVGERCDGKHQTGAQLTPQLCIYDVSARSYSHNLEKGISCRKEFRIDTGGMAATPSVRLMCTFVCSCFSGIVIGVVNLCHSLPSADKTASGFQSIAPWELMSRGQTETDGGISGF